MFDFGKSAIESTTLTDLMAGRTKISTEELINKYPAGVTLIDFDIITTPNKRRGGELNTYPVFIFAEDDTVFGYGGKVLYNILGNWVSKGFDGDIEGCRKAYKESTNKVKFKFTHGTSANGNGYTMVDIVK